MTNRCLPGRCASELVLKRTKTQRRIGGKANQDQLKAPDVTSRDGEGGGTGRNGELTQGHESSAQLELRL
jgi:hypothetical protein